MPDSFHPIMITKIRIILSCLIYCAFIQSAFANHLFPSTQIAMTPYDDPINAPIIHTIVPKNTIGIGVIYLLGDNFQPGATVTIDGIHSEAVYYSSTQLMFEVPMHEMGTVAVLLSNPNGLTAIVPNGLTYVELPYSYPIPDSGPTKCYDNDSEIPCPNPDESFYGQAGNYTINEMSFTKLDNNGNDLPEDSPQWVMVRDNVTGLIWEVKQAKDMVQDYDNPNDADNTYSWYDTDFSNNLGNEGSDNDGKNTQKFIEQLNEKRLGGFNDWRMPSPQEIESIANLAMNNPAIDLNFFPGSMSLFYWSSTSFVNNSDSAWGVDFEFGEVSNFYKSMPHFVRAVRGERALSSGKYVMNGNNTITDVARGIMWELKTIRKTWEEAIDHCENLSTAMFTDWRLPEQKELLSIVDFSQRFPATNQNVFSDVKNSYYCSSTSNAKDTGNVWDIGFDNGDTHYNKAKSERFNVRAIRGGQPRLLNHLYIIGPRQGSIWKRNHVMPIKWETQNIPGNVNISISREGGRVGTYEAIAETENDGDYEWNVTGVISVNCMLKIEPINEPDKGTCQGLFCIYPYTTQVAISPIHDQTIDEDSIGLISFTITDADSEPCDLTLNITSSNQRILPDNNISYVCLENNYTITTLPETNKNGTVLLTLIAKDHVGLTSGTSFQLTISSVDDPPTISDIPNQTLKLNSACSLSFTIADTDSTHLTVSATSSNLSLVAIDHIGLDNQGSIRSISITPTENMSGSSIITLAVTDGNITVTSAFELSVTPNYLPEIPSLPVPEHNETGISQTPVLSWQCSDQNPEDILSYDVYLSQSQSLTDAVAKGLTATFLLVSSPLSVHTPYFWRVDAIDQYGAKQVGPIWKFTVIDNKSPEITIQSISQRTDGSSHIDICFTGMDPENDVVEWSKENCIFASKTQPAEYLRFDMADPDHTAYTTMKFSIEGTSYTAVIDASSWETGNYTITLGVDQSTIVSYPFYLDHTPPEAPIIMTDGGNGAGTDYTTTVTEISLEGICSTDTETLFINNELLLHNNQNWQRLITLSEGKNRFDIMASDLYGNMIATSITITRIHKPMINMIVSSSPIIGGTIKINNEVVSLPFTQIFNYGMTILIEAIPETDYTFVQWQGHLNNMTDKQQILMATDDMNLTAIFNRSPYKPHVDSISVENLSVTLKTDAFMDADLGDSHFHTLLQLWRDDQPKSKPIEIIMDACTSTKIPETILDTGLKYCCQIGYQDTGSRMTTWSDEQSFITGSAKAIISSQIPPGIHISEYRMVSFTQWPSDPRATILFSYLSTDEDDFRMGTYDPEISNYIEYSDDLLIKPGRAYWILNKYGCDMALNEIPVSMEVDIDVELQFNPDYPDDGWNMIACPNDATYQWGSIQVMQYDDNGHIIVSPLAISTMKDEGLIDIRLWQWNHNEQPPYICHTNFDFELSPYKGYWVKALKNNVFLRFPKDSQIRTTRNKRTIEKRLEYTSESPPMPMSDMGIIEVYESTPGACFISRIIRKFCVFDVSFFIVIIFLSALVAFKKKNK